MGADLPGVQFEVAGLGSTSHTGRTGILWLNTSGAEDNCKFTATSMTSTLREALSTGWKKLNDKMKKYAKILNLIGA